MAQRARVTSVDALDSFRASLIVYLSQARPALEEISTDVLRTRSWLENDQRMFWENQLRRRARDLEEAKQALFSARISTFQTESSLEQLAVHRAKRALDEADQKLRILKKWRREFEGRVQPLVKQVEKLHTVLSHDMVQAAAYLSQTLNTLAAYAEVKAPAAATGPAPVAEQKTAEHGPAPAPTNPGEVK